MVAALWPRAHTYRVVVFALLVSLVAVATWMGSIVLSPAGTLDSDSCPEYRPLDPSSGVMHVVSDQVELAAALKAARPGDVVNLADGTYDEIQFRSDYGHQSGTATAPIVIQAAAGAHPVVDRGQGTVSDRYVVTIIDVSHVQVRGLEIRHGIHGPLASGSDSIIVEHNDIHHVAMAGVVVNSSEDDGKLKPSTNILIRCNRIHHTGMIEPEYGEGIYLGSGKTGVTDQSRDVVIEGNEIYSISNEAIDVKRHVTNVTIRHNLIHDVTPFYGGAISLGLNKNSWGPANYLVEHNRIWSVRSGLYYAQAIAVAHGPTIIRNNLIWDIETNPSDTWPWTAEIQVHGDDNDADWAYGFGNPAATRVVIEGNTVIGCRQACISSHTDDGQIRPDLTVADNIVDQPSGGDAVNPDDIVVAAADLLGPVTGTADSGDGPGSGLAVPPADEDPPTTPTSQTPATSTSAPATSTTSTTQPPTDSTAATTSATTSATTTPSTTDSTVAPGAVDTDLDTVKDIVTTTDTAIEPLLGTAAETTADGVAEPGIGGSGGKPLRVTDTDHDPAHDAAPSNSADAAPSSSAAGSIAPSRSGADSRSAATFVWSANRADSRGDSPTRGVHGSGLALTKRPPTFGRDRQHRIRVQEFAGFEAGDLSLETVSRLLVAPDQ